MKKLSDADSIDAKMKKGNGKIKHFEEGRKKDSSWNDAFVVAPLPPVTSFLA